MIWRESTVHDSEAILQLTREPMGGDIQLIWGLSELRAPDECHNFKAYCIETEGTVTGCTLSWDWPDQSRYIGGLRFGSNMANRPRPRFWKEAFESMLDGVDYAWTCIGAENNRARRMLESKFKWLPHYNKRQEITTWFVPLAKKRRNTAPKKNDTIQIADWRHVAIASGKGISYRIGRAMQCLSFPGVPEPMQSLRLAYHQPSDHASQSVALKEVAGFDALILVLPTDSAAARHWQTVVPRIHWKWSSALYSVSWNRELAPPEIPNWKGIWL